MNVGILHKAFRETIGVTIALALGLCVMEVLFVYALSTFFEEMTGPLLQMPFVRRLVAAFLGVDAGQEIGPMLLVSLAWVHPVILSLLLAHALIVCTRVPSGEIDRGTIDLILSVPATRTNLYVMETMVWLFTGLTVVTAALIGNLAASAALRASSMGPIAHRALVALNLYALYVSAGGIAWFASSICDRRGRAIAIAFTVLIASLFIHILSAFNATMKSIAFLSVFEYHRPIHILQSSASGVRDMLILLAIGFLFWLAGLAVFTRRDIPAL
ncbi:MAG: ABC transporter permease subunit [Planctomycetes bacterium]|nr:ABC transporter permease subunit [Planctomycetota bacterium]MBI3834324.1 ABC transporter permease subunit [Planctomycetota bacterium]